MKLISYLTFGSIWLALSAFYFCTMPEKNRPSANGETPAAWPVNRDQTLPQLPIALPDSEYKSLESCQSAALQRRLEQGLRANPKFHRLILDKKLCLGVVDLTDWNNPRYASINGKEMIYAASLPKIAVLLAAQDAIHKQELTEDAALREDMNAMIRFSNNAATTRVIDRLGYEKIERVLRAPEYRFYEESEGGGLWVGKRYSRSGETNREPLKNLSHAATAYQVSRFYYRLVYGRLVSFERSADMLSILKDPGLHHKFVHSLDQLAPDAALYRKSGSWKSWHSDSILVWDDDRRYILVALTEDPGGEETVRSLVRPVEEAMLLRTK